jgi:hypothetical protein
LRWHLVFAVTGFTRSYPQPSARFSWIDYRSRNRSPPIELSDAPPAWPELRVVINVTRSARGGQPQTAARGAAGSSATVRSGLRRPAGGGGGRLRRRRPQKEAGRPAADREKPDGLPPRAGHRASTLRSREPPRGRRRWPTDSAHGGRPTGSGRPLNDRASPEMRPVLLTRLGRNPPSGTPVTR